MGDVEIDGAYFGGYVKPAIRKEDRKDRRYSENQSGKRQCVVVMRERNGRTLPFVCSRLRRAEIGTHHCISRNYLRAYAWEMAWRQDTCRMPDGMLYELAVTAAMTQPKSAHCGYLAAQCVCIARH